MIFTENPRMMIIVRSLVIAINNQRKFKIRMFHVVEEKRRMKIAFQIQLKTATASFSHARNLQYIIVLNKK
jgi:hypothetical protein